MPRAAWIEIALALFLAPLLAGVIARVKAKVAGRHGPPLTQLYSDLGKLLRKGAVYSTTTTWVFRAGPLVTLASTATALLLLPYGDRPAPVAFAADFVLLAGLLALGRYFTVAAALDTGSAFEGLGASREVHFAALAEPALLLGLTALARKTSLLSLSALVPAASPLAPEVLLVAGALCVLLLSENSRVPFDDPNTHLELTMIHEVMLLDHGGPDLAFAEYAAALKLWIWCALVSGVALPPVFKQTGWPVALPTLAAIFVTAVGIGLVESTLSRLRLVRVPHLLATATALASLALILGTR
jgi:formate hydrogenlyase subunit 4